MLTDECESAKNWPPEEPLLLEAYAFGDVLRGADPLDCVEIVLVAIPSRPGLEPLRPRAGPVLVAGWA